LVRTIHEAPLFVKPPVGNNPFQAVANAQPEQTGDPVKQLMELVVEDFEDGDDYSHYDRLRPRMEISRVMFDTLLAKATGQGLVRVVGKVVQITDAGKAYAVEYKLV
jgi:hypothetical protein